MRIPRRAALSLLASPAFAQSWPNRPLRIIVPFPPGGGVDLTARLLSEPLARELGQTVVIENRGGAGGVIGVEAMSRAPADGYTLSLTGAGTITAGPHLRRLPYDALGLAHVTMLVRMPFIVAVRSDLPARTLPEFLALARQGGLRYASGGPGTSQHLTGELFNQMAGLAMEHVPYRSTPPAMTDVIAGRVTGIIVDVAASRGFLQEGKLRSLGITSATRTPLLPNEPTLAEAGLPGFELLSWMGAVGPARMPPEIVTAWNAALRKVWERQETADRLASFGIERVTSTPEEFGVFIRSQIETWARQIKAAGIEPE